MRLPGLDVIFGLAAPAVDILVKHTSIADLQVRDDEACIGSVRAGLDAGDDALDAAPAFSAVEELLETAHVAASWRGVEAGCRGRFEALDVTAQRRGRRHAEDEIEAPGSTPVENLWTSVLQRQRGRRCNWP